MPVVRAATRGSSLALWQATHVARLLEAAHPGLHVEFVVVDTEGDRRLDVPISEFGGKGVFAKEVQAAVLDDRADFAVHSAKDMPSQPIPGLELAAVPERGDPRDALVGGTLTNLPRGASVATGSMRRRVQLAQIRPDLVFTELRGNMATRLSKVPEGGAIVVAAVALQRLQLAEHLSEIISPDEMVPQVGQGALGIECRSGDDAVIELLQAIEHEPSRRRVDAERAFLVELGGDCDLPAGAHAVFVDDVGDVAPTGTLRLSAFLATDGTASADLVRMRSLDDDPVALGTQVAKDLRRALNP
ncbi:hydroxymethylbilane synthase [Aquihabitans daechungensis]|uniref:hydroxymethylbilane synthase n=1 Tax=Aquihabitans daechungensis TaxID=1052257 RepID=UPI003B9EEACE